METAHGFEYNFQGVPVVFPYNAYDVQARSSQLSNNLSQYRLHSTTPGTIH